MNGENGSGPREQQVLAAEEARCKALVDRDFDRIRELLSPQLTHTHTGGNTEDFELYMSLLQGPMQYISIIRRDLSVRLHGPVAVMDGMAETTGRLGEGDPMTLNTRVLQVWVEEGDRWRMVAFQATKIA
jgi:ketosteroid isomerase-like protein